MATQIGAGRMSASLAAGLSSSVMFTTVSSVPASGGVTRQSPEAAVLALQAVDTVPGRG